NAPAETADGYRRPSIIRNFSVERGLTFSNSINCQRFNYRQCGSRLSMPAYTWRVPDRTVFIDVFCVIGTYLFIFGLSLSKHLTRNGSQQYCGKNLLHIL